MTTARSPRVQSTPKKAAPSPRKASQPRKSPVPKDKPVEAVKEAPEAILIHFVNVGLCVFGYDWQPGQELEIVKPSPEYDRTCDAEGSSWLDMTEDEQTARWGAVMFRKGPSDIPNAVLNYKTITGDGVDSYGRPKYYGYLSVVEREKAAKAEIERGRKLPTL